jgi:alkylation response protein AidB-like acyl-CoA dehydrogenase
MDLRLTSEQQQMVASFAALYGRRATPAAVRAAEPVGHDAQLWAALIDVGAVAMAVAERDGGGGASMLDLALVAEVHGRAVAPAPLIDAQVTARLLARLGATAAPILARVLAGDQLVAFAPRASVGNALRLVPAGAVADHIVARQGDRIVAVPGCGAHVENLGALPLADLVTDDAVVLAEGAAAAAVWDTAIDEWLLLIAACLIGVAARSLELGVAYAKEREAFGVPIGTFQAVAHPLADLATAIDGARLLTHLAAWSCDEEPSLAAERGGLAYAMACEAARDATKRSLHVHGGYGFVMEHDIQLFFRRARAWALTFGPAEAGLDRAADRRYGPVAAR